LPSIKTKRNIYRDKIEAKEDKRKEKEEENISKEKDSLKESQTLFEVKRKINYKKKPE